MKNANYILEELNIISPLLGQIEKKEAYSVPSAYFDSLLAEIIDRIKTGKERAYFSKAFTPFSIPADYFKNFPDLVLKKMLADSQRDNEVFEELKEIAPLLNTISKKPVHYTPMDFFDKISFPAALPKPEAKVKLINNRLKLVKFAAAAVIIPFIAIGLYSITTNESKISRSDSSKARNAIKHLSKEEIINFLKNGASENTTSASRNTSKDANVIKSSLKQISVQEIQQFLKETGESDEI
jgi:hypothetical protein